jgi:hypothetical protein
LPNFWFLINGIIPVFSFGNRNHFYSFHHSWRNSFKIENSY